MSKTPLDFALEYAEQGLVLLPLKRFDTGKTHPMLKNGFSYDWVGSSDLATVRAWWTYNARWWRGWEWNKKKSVGGYETMPPDWEVGDPVAGIGLVTGVRSKLLVIDVDVKKVDGRESLIALQNERGYSFVDCPAVKTPSGGMHLYLKLEEGQDVRRKVGWLPGVDASGSGGYVALPPSAKIVNISSPRPWEPAHSELREYSWYRGDVGDAPPAPAWLLEDINTRPVTIPQRNGEPISSSDGDRLPPTSEFCVLGLGWFLGSRNRDLYRLAYRLWSGIKTEAEVLEIVRECYDATADTSDFTWDEVLKTVYSARERRRRFSPSLSDMIPEGWRKEVM